MMLVYHQGDERPAWQSTVTINGATDDLSTGYSFTVLIQRADQAPVLTKTTNITGAAAGVVTVAWASGDLDLTPGLYKVLLTALRAADSLEWTVRDDLRILGR
jgi:hypothetical protein